MDETKVRHDWPNAEILCQQLQKIILYFWQSYLPYSRRLSGQTNPDECGGW
jgi:hypothetical protein